MSAIVDSTGQPIGGAIDQSNSNPAASPDGQNRNDASPESNTDATRDENSQDEPRSFTQAELDAIVSKEKAKTEARAERRMLRALEKLQPRETPAPAQADRHSAGDDKPTRAAYAGNDEAYIEALTEWKIGQREQATRAERDRQQGQALHERTEKLYTEAGKFEGFDRQEFDALPLTSPMVQALLDSDVAPQLMALLTDAPDEVERISKLSPARQAAEIGKLEAKAEKKGPRAQPSNAPSPINPVGARGGSSAGNLDSMSNEEYRKTRAKQGAKWARGAT